ncbi:hypothetical protein GCM10009548_65020 [Streptomyces malaysiensis subsp. malaysiensis]
MTAIGTTTAVRTEIARFRTEIAPFRTEVARLRAETAPFQTEIARLRTETARLDTETARFRAPTPTRPLTRPLTPSTPNDNKRHKYDYSPTVCSQNDSSAAKGTRHEPPRYRKPPRSRGLRRADRVSGDHGGGGAHRGRRGLRRGRAGRLRL